MAPSLRVIGRCAWSWTHCSHGSGRKVHVAFDQYACFIEELCRCLRRSTVSCGIKCYPLFGARHTMLQELKPRRSGLERQALFGVCVFAYDGFQHGMRYKRQ